MAGFESRREASHELRASAPEVTPRPSYFLSRSLVVETTFPRLRHLNERPIECRNRTTTKQSQSPLHIPLQNLQRPPDTRLSRSRKSVRVTASDQNRPRAQANRFYNVA